MESNNLILNSLSLDDVLGKEEVITEAYFIKGKEKIKPIEDAFAAIKAKYDIVSNGKTLNTEEFRKFVKDDVFKDLEKNIIEILGVRSVNIFPMIIKQYSGKSKGTEILNAWTYLDTNARFVIDGLITDEGFYDKTHTLHTTMEVSTGLFEKCTPAQMTAIFLHEFGHNIDPNIINIEYTGINYIVDSMLGKDNSANKNSKEIKKRSLGSDLGAFFIVMLIYIIGLGIPFLITWLKEKFTTSEKKLKELEKLIKDNKLKLDTIKDTEAFADNIARMYGYGKDLTEALKIINTSYEELQLNSLQGKEEARRKVMINMIKSGIKDVHGTDIQRVRALINSYEEDLKDPNLPSKVKKNMEEDLEGLKEIYKLYSEEKDEFKRRLNKLIMDELEKEYGIIDDKKEKDIKESFNKSDVFEEKFKSEDYISLTAEEREIATKRFGKTECSIMKDKDGYFAMTHRARSKSYYSLEKLPKNTVDFVSSTS